jgi:hypothetical protein
MGNMQASEPAHTALLERNILEMLTVHGVLALEDLRARLTVASESRMRTALAELRRRHLITVGEGKDVLVSLSGERRKYIRIGDK